jgi:hypothetical protein
MSIIFRRFAKRKAELDEEIQAHLGMDIHARMSAASPRKGRVPWRCESLEMWR